MTTRGSRKPKSGETTRATASGRLNPDLQKQLDRRTRELAKTRKLLKEALQQQSAAAEVLQVINSSPVELAPVFNAMLKKAMQLCEAAFGGLWVFEGDRYAAKALCGVPAAYAGYLQNANIIPGPHTAPYRFLQGERSAIQNLDLAAEDPYLTGDPQRRALVDLGGARTALQVPLVRNDTVLGVITIYRQEVKRFSEPHVKLLQSFAAQAVIAIENARLFNETKEALDRQTATAEVLQVINSSPGDLAPVFEAILEKAHSLCAVSHGSLQLYDGEKFRAVAAHGIAEAFADRLRHGFVPGPNHPSQQLLQGARFAQVPDCAEINDPIVRAAFELGGIRTVLLIPLYNEGSLIGQIAAARRDVSPFTENEIALLENFAAQTVIAMENARLFEEVQAKTRDLQESLEFQTASADVLKVISRSPDTLQPVLDVIVETSRRLCGSLTSIIFLLRDGKFHVAAQSQAAPDRLAFLRANPIAIEQRGSGMARAARERRTVHVPNTADDSEFSHGGPLGFGQSRALLSVPLIHDNQVIGGIALTQSTAMPFTSRQIEAVESFADQAVIAISNVNLFEQVQERTRELARSLDELRAAQDRLIQTEKLASLGQLTAGIAHEIKNPLNFVNNFAALSVELADELKEVLNQEKLTDKGREGVHETTGLLKENLTKVVQHGMRADSIVKNMLLHSREGSGERRLADVNAIVEESLNLAYHGARAEKPSFNITLVRNLDQDAGVVEVYPQEITRVFLNLISNAFYAATKREEADKDGFEPTLTASTRGFSNRVEIRIRDNGIGIPEDVKAKIFNPFFTTKPAGEGTGLGLSMSHDIIVKQHGGTIDVATEPGVFTEFVVTLPRATSAQKPVRGEN